MKLSFHLLKGEFIKGFCLLIVNELGAACEDIPDGICDGVEANPVGLSPKENDSWLSCWIEFDDSFEPNEKLLSLATGEPNEKADWDKDLSGIFGLLSIRETEPKLVPLVKGPDEELAENKGPTDAGWVFEMTLWTGLEKICEF